MAWSSEYEGAYPRELWHQERALLSARRGAALEGVERPPDDTLGVALSGGGIRSATFSLGVFQALAGFGLVGRIDYLSTVSGGGYFGAFLGRLFSRREIQTTRQVEQLLSGAPASGGTPAVSTMPDVVRWLRENGRYLSPNGAGDLLQAGAGLLRNWIAIQIVLLSFFVMLFLAGQLVGGLVAVSRPMWSAAYMAALDWYLPGRALVWWSPYITLWLLPFVVGAIPLGWAYWMIGRVGARGRLRSAPEPASVDGLRPLGPGRAGRTRTQDHRPFQRARGRAAPRPAAVHRGDHAGPAHRHPPAHPHRCRVARHRVELQDSRLRALVLVGRAGPALRESPRDVRRPVCPRAGLARSRALLPPVRVVLAFSQRLLAAVLVQRPPHPRLPRSVEPAACRSHQPESHARPPGGQHGSGQLLSEPRSGKRRQDAAAPPDQRHHKRDRRRQVPDRAAGSQGRRARHRPPVVQRRRPTPRGLD